MLGLGGTNWVGLYMNRSSLAASGACALDEASGVGDETKSDGADPSIGAGEGTKNCGTDGNGVAAGYGSSKGKGLLTEVICTLDGLT